MLPLLILSSAKQIIKQILVIANLKWRKDLFWEVVFMIWSFPANNYLFKVSNWSTIIRRESCSDEDSRKISTASFWCFYCSMGTCFTHCSNCCNFQRLLGSYWKYNQDKIRYIMHVLCCSNFSVKKIY